METSSILPSIFLKDFQYEILEDTDVKILSKQRPEHEFYSNFPQIINLSNIEVSIEFNLFLIDKFRFNNFSANKSKAGDEISILRIKSIQTALTVFLNWLTKNKINWKDENYLDNEDPVSLFKNYLIDRIISQDKHLEYETAKRYLDDIKMLFEWAVHKNIITRLPFTYSFHYNSNEHSSTITSKKAPIFQNVTRSIKIPKKYKDIKNKKLSAYTPEEYSNLINTQYCQSQNRQIWIKLARYYGLRRTEIINLNEDILDESKNGLYKVTGKFSKKREIYFKQNILDEIKEYCNTRSRKISLQKYFEKNKYTPTPPLFINNQGNRVSHSTITNIIYPAKSELRKNGIKFDKTFHDLRATYALYRFMELMKKGIDMQHIEFVITDELGHNLFETTKKYLTTKKARESWMTESNIGDVLNNIDFYRDEEILNDFL